MQTKNKPNISVILCTFNRAYFLEEALNSLLKQKTNDLFSFEIVVIDDKSTDNTESVISELSRKYKSIIKYRIGLGKGYTHALNLGVRNSEGEWLAFFDDDEYAMHAWLLSLYKAAQELDSHIIGGPIEIEFLQKNKSDFGPICRSLYGEYPPNHIINKFYKNPLPGGGNRLVHRTVFDTVGLFDESILTGGCDRDLLLRAIDKGFKTKWVPNAIVRHKIPPHRLDSAHIKWYSQQAGSSFAYIDCKRYKKLKTVFLCLARVGQAVIVNLPLLIIYIFKKEQSKSLDKKIQIWRAIGYLRKTLSLIFPNILVQKKYQCQMEFRKKR